MNLQMLKLCIRSRDKDLNQRTKKQLDCNTFLISILQLDLQPQSINSP